MHYEAPIVNRFLWTLDISLQDDMQSIVYQELRRTGYEDVDCSLIIDPIFYMESFSAQNAGNYTAGIQHKTLLVLTGFGGAGEK